MRHWKIVSASVRGVSHLKNDLPCQDAHCVYLVEPDILIVAVADGAGSAERSETGSRIAAKTAAGYLYGFLSEWVPNDEHHWEEQLLEAFSQAREAVLAAATLEAESPRQFATTLTVVVVDPRWMVTGQIGDGVVVASTLDQELITVAPAQKGEYANETNFLTMADALNRMEGRVYCLGKDIEPVRAVAAFSDGLSRLAMSLPEEQPHRPFFKPVLKFATDSLDSERANAELADFLDSPRVNARTDDDKTLVLAIHQFPEETGQWDALNPDHIPQAMTEDTAQGAQADSGVIEAP